MPSSADSIYFQSTCDDPHTDKCYGYPVTDDIMRGLSEMARVNDLRTSFITNVSGKHATRLDGVDEELVELKKRVEELEELVKELVKELAGKR